MKVLSLFTGAGGLDLGLEEAGFSIAGCVEIDADCRKTLRANRSWRLAEPGDIHVREPAELLRSLKLGRGEIAVLSGGPPCQPFSKAAYWRTGGSRRLSDPRALTLSRYLDVLEAALPEVALIENVKGISFRGKDEGLALLRAGFERVNRRHGTAYNPQVIHLDAVDYGVPQRRERVFIVATRAGVEIDVPAPTHGGTKRHATAWDAIGDLADDDPPAEVGLSGKWSSLIPSIPEGENYLWHTSRGGGEPLFGWRTRYWSFLLKLAKDNPAWTLQAAAGPATGPFHWFNRRLTRTELARLQTFPDGYNVGGSYTSAQRQIGNAVPSAIGELLGLTLRRQVFGERPRNALRLIPAARDDCPGHENPGPVPSAMLALRGQHDDHPGTGKGPGARKRAAQAGEDDSLAA